MNRVIDLDKTPLSLEQLLKQLTPDTMILLVKDGTLVARILPEGAGQSITMPRKLGLHAGQGWISEDFTDELPDSFWLGETE